MRYKVLSTANSSECSRREFVSSVMFWLASAFIGVTISVEHFLSGILGRGKTDYSLIYNLFQLLVTECKKDVLNEAIPQNVAQMQAARQVNRLSFVWMLFIFACYLLFLIWAGARTKEKARRC